MARKKGEQQEMPVTTEAHEAQEAPASAAHEDAATSDGEPSDEPTKAPEDMATVKERWLNRRVTIDAVRKDLTELERLQDADETTIAYAAIDAGTKAKTEAVVQIGAYRMKAKHRPAKHGGGVMLVDAPIAAALEI